MRRTAFARAVFRAACILSGPLAAAPRCPVPTGEYHPTQLPFTYVLDRRNPFDKSFLESYREGMPFLVEAGQLTPGHPYFGPVCDLGALRRGVPEPPVGEFVNRYRANRSRIPAAVAGLRAAGAGQVITYICMMTTGGDPAKRTGFWRFYDHWDAFAEFQIPARPAEDPEAWQQRQPDGSPVIAYTRAHPPYAPMFRWTNCVNHPGWRAYQRWVTEEAARLGVDGFFVDNANTMRCYCRHCQTRFAERLRERYTAEEQAELFGGDLAMAPGGKPPEGLRRAEVYLFWQESIREFLADIKAWGSAIRGRFYVFPNGLQGMSDQIGTRFRDCDLAMHEDSGGDLGGNPGVVRRHAIAGLYTRRVKDHLYEFRAAAGAGAVCRANVLAYAGYPKADPEHLGPNPNVALLGMAEAAAFGGGGSYAPIELHPWYAGVCAEFGRFVAANSALYAGKYPFGEVGVLAFVWPGFLGDRAAAALSRASLLDALGRHVLADLIPERVFSPEWLARYRAVVVPGCTVLTDEQLGVLAAYARQGGRLVVLGAEAGTRDACGRPRPLEALAGFREAAFRCDRDLGPAWASGGPLAGLELCPENAGPLVRFAAYADAPRDPRQIVLHAVNYDVDVGLGAVRVGAVEGLEVSIHLPPGTRAVQAVWKAPGAPDCPLEVEAGAGGGRARFRIPRLDVYGLAAVTLTEKGAP